MGIVDRRQELFENILRLRRASQEMPGNRDLASVRVALERDLGETVSRRLAARVLGVSHTALDRWIKSGDIPVVHSRERRLEVPVSALLTLYESVRAESEEGRPRYALTPIMARQRDAANRLQIDPVVHSEAGHDRARARGLAYHQAVARRLRKPMVDDARHALFRWREQERIDPRYADQWEHVLARPVSEIRKALIEDSQTGDDLRQNSPFAGVLSEPERRQILRATR
ncbi:MAG TPA: hypothetical protein VGF15_05710 [Solirubrobacteraceae bacterium]|jgi:hypothetical protein